MNMILRCIFVNTHKVLKFNICWMINCNLLSLLFACNFHYKIGCGLLLNFLIEVFYCYAYQLSYHQIQSIFCVLYLDFIWIALYCIWIVKCLKPVISRLLIKNWYFSLYGSLTYKWIFSISGWWFIKLSN